MIRLTCPGTKPARGWNPFSRIQPGCLGTLWGARRTHLGFLRRTCSSDGRGDGEYSPGGGWLVAVLRASREISLPLHPSRGFSLEGCCFMLPAATPYCSAGQQVVPTYWKDFLTSGSNLTPGQQVELSLELGPLGAAQCPLCDGGDPGWARIPRCRDGGCPPCMQVWQGVYPSFSTERQVLP